MPPTIPTARNVDQRPPGARPTAGERRSELVCRVKFCNTLPDIPFDPKFITYPFESTRFIQYNPTSLERNYKYEVLTEHDLGVGIDLINRDQYAADHRTPLDPADEKLLEEDILAHHDSKRSRHHSRSVSWLRRTEYISTEQTRFQPHVMEKVEAKVGYSIKKTLKEETLLMDRESQITAIEKTFDDAKKPIEKHYSKPNVVPVEVLNVYPDFKLWKYPSAQVMFDSDPAPVGRPYPAQMEEMSQAMIRGVMDESGEQFVAYFLPTEATLEKRRRDLMDGVDYQDEEEYEYIMAREYNWNVKSKASKGYEENYFLIIRSDGAYYNELETRVRLSKRRQKVGQQATNTRLVVKHRPMNAVEFNIHRAREKQLEPPLEEDEDEEEEEDEEEDEKGDEGGRDSDKEGSGNESDGEARSGKGEKDSSRSGSSGSEASDNEKPARKARRKASADSGATSDSDREGSRKGDSDKDSRDSDKDSKPSRSPSPSDSHSSGQEATKTARSHSDSDQGGKKGSDGSESEGGEDVEMKSVGSGKASAASSRSNSPSASESSTPSNRSDDDD